MTAVTMKTMVAAIGARRQPRYSADAVTGGAAAAEPRAEADQQPGRRQ